MLDEVPISANGTPCTHAVNSLIYEYYIQHRYMRIKRNTPPIRVNFIGAKLLASYILYELNYIG